MNDDPQRLEDGELGAALAAERAAGFAAARVEAAKAAVRARIAGGVPPRRPWLRIAGGTGAAALLVAAAAHWAWPSGDPGHSSSSNDPRLSSNAPAAHDGGSSAMAAPTVAPPENGTRAAVVSSLPAHVPPAAPASTPEGDLPEQIARYQAAQAAADAGRLEDAIGSLDSLLAQWPASPLRAEVELSKGEYLARARRDPEAIALLSRLLDDPAQAAKRVEIALLLGDEEVRSGDCDAARKTLAIPVDSGTADQAAAASGALARCASKIP